MGDAHMQARSIWRVEHVTVRGRVCNLNKFLILFLTHVGKRYVLYRKEPLNNDIPIIMLDAWCDHVSANMLT
jgi:hypothetical protein